METFIYVCSVIVLYTTCTYERDISSLILVIQVVGTFSAMILSFMDGYLLIYFASLFIQVLSFYNNVFLISASLRREITVYLNEKFEDLFSISNVSNLLAHFENANHSKLFVTF